MQITTSLLPPDQTIPLDVDVAVVIDVLRATSVMATALNNGAAGVITCREVSEAIKTADRLSPSPLLCGERGCRPIDGFDLGNSPAEYARDRIAGKTLVLTTTNGTRAVESVASVPKILAACFLNLAAVLQALESAKRVHLVCSGTEGHVTSEDVLLAGAIVSACESVYRAEVCDDASIIARQLWVSWFGQGPGDGDEETLSRRLRESQGGKNLVRVGYQADLLRCAAINSLDAVPWRSSSDPAMFQLLAR